MSFIKDFCKRMLWVQVFGLTGLLIAGWVLTLIQRDVYCPQQNFFTYHIESIDQVPAWFCFALLQTLINGAAMIRLAVLQGGIHTPDKGPYGSWGFDVPIQYLRLFGVNLMYIPIALFAFLAIRHSGM